MYSLLQFDIPVVLGPTGTALAALVILAQTTMAFYSWRRSNSVKILKDELDIYKGRVERMEVDIKELRASEADCQRKLSRMTSLYLELRGEEEDDARRSGERKRQR